MELALLQDKIADDSSKVVRKDVGEDKKKMQGNSV